MNKSSSFIKLDVSSEEEEEEVGETDEFNFLINSDTLMGFMIMLCRCPEC